MQAKFSINFQFSNYLISTIGASLFFLLLVLITKGKGMGLGDVKYGAFMGLLLGYPGIVVGLYTAFLTGALVGVILIIAKKRKFGQIIPFGPFLVLGTVVAMFWGNQLLNWLWHYL
jgi:prepilin signal peptidase PulO-like enzyme (type II secretory pathway)